MNSQPTSNNSQRSAILKADSNIFSINKGDKRYQISIKYKKDTIDFSVNIDLCPNIYQALYTYDDFSLINKIFSHYDNLKEIYQIIVEKFVDKNIDVLEDAEKFVMKFDLQFLKIKKDIILPLQRNVVHFLTEKIRKMEEKEQEIRIITDKIIQNLSDKIIKMEEEITKLKTPSSLQGSYILKRGEYDLIKSWCYVNNFRLLYRSSRDGRYAEDFHDKCDNKGKTITIVETTDGYRLGAYTSVSWDSLKDAQYKNDRYAFVFSLNDAKKYTCHNYEYAINCLESHGPRFGKKDLYINHNFSMLTNHFHSYGEKEGVDSHGYLIGRGSKEAAISEVEVYLVGEF